MEEKYKSKYCSPNEYTHIGILTIPGGDHRVKIINVVEKQYGNTSLQALEITLKVSGHRGLLWYRLMLDPKNKNKTDKKIASFFQSFDITDNDLSNYKKWKGKHGAVRVMHTTDQETGNIKAFVCFCLSGLQKDVLPPFSDVAQYDAGELHTHTFLKYLNKLDDNKLWFYYKLILGLRYKDGEGRYCFVSKKNVEEIEKIFYQKCCCIGCESDESMNPDCLFESPICFQKPKYCILDGYNTQDDRELLIQTLLKYVDKKSVLARKIATELSLYGFYGAIYEIKKRIKQPVALFGMDLSVVKESIR